MNADFNIGANLTRIFDLTTEIKLSAGKLLSRIETVGKELSSFYRAVDTTIAPATEDATLQSLTQVGCTLSDYINCIDSVGNGAHMLADTINRSATEAQGICRSIALQLNHASDLLQHLNKSVEDERLYRLLDAESICTALAEQHRLFADLCAALREAEDTVNIAVELTQTAPPPSLDIDRDSEMPCMEESFSHDQVIAACPGLPSIAVPDSVTGIGQPEFNGGAAEAPSMPTPPVAAAPMASAAPAKPKKVKPVRVDSVSFSVLSPERVKAGEYSSVDVYMYTKSQRKLIEKAIKAAESAVKETGKSGFSVSRGTEVSVILSADSEDVKITDEVDTRTWDGECCQFDFQFFVPEGYAKKQIAFTCQVLFGGIQITRLHFTVGLSGGSAAKVPVRVKRKDCRKAFVSYSHKDEKRVLNLLSEIVSIAPKMMFWLDSQSMESGDIWRKEIRRAIRNADVFLLFWSIYSCKSAEVEKEWRYARQKKGIRFILPVPLDPPAECPPPKELGEHLHFGSRSLAYTAEMDGLTFASSKQFRKIK